MVKSNLNLLLQYLQDLFPSELNRRTFKYKTKKTNLNNIANQSVFVFGIRLWNALPLVCKMSTSLGRFKKLVFASFFGAQAPIC